MIASKDALGLILPKLKDHLERAQVYLGKIHRWAMHSTNDLSILNLDFWDVLKISPDISSDASSSCGDSFFNGLVLCTETKCK